MIIQWHIDEVIVNPKQLKEGATLAGYPYPIRVSERVPLNTIYIRAGVQLIALKYKEKELDVTTEPAPSQRDQLSVHD